MASCQTCRKSAERWRISGDLSSESNSDAEISGFLERNFFQSPRGPRIIRTKMGYQRADHASRIPDAGAYRVYGILQEDVNLLFTNHCRDYQNIQMLLHIPLL